MQIARLRGEKEYSDAYDVNLKRRPYSETRQLDADRAGICVRAAASAGLPGRILTRSSTLRNTRCVNLTLAVMLAIHTSAPGNNRGRDLRPYRTPRFRALSIFRCERKSERNALISNQWFSAAAIIKP